MSFFRRNVFITVCIIIVAVFLVFISMNIRRDGETGLASRAVLETVGPLGGVVNALFSGFGDAWHRYLVLVDVEEKNRELEKTVSRLRKEIIQYQESQLECDRLRKMADAASKLDVPMVAARVIGKESPAAFKTILINRGTSDGVRTGSPVLAAAGLVGRVVEASRNAAKVLLLIDYNSNIDALIMESRIQGIIQGNGPDGCLLKYVQSIEEVNAGDAVITSGLSGIFPKGLLIGRVSIAKSEGNSLFKKIIVAPAVDVSRLEEVMVMVQGKGVRQ